MITALRVLGLWPVGKELALFCSFAGAGFGFLQALEVADQEEQANDAADAVSEQSFHEVQKYPSTNCNPICNSASTAKA